MTTFQDPPPHSRRSARQSERDEMPDAPAAISDDSPAVPTSATPESAFIAPIASAPAAPEPAPDNPAADIHSAAADVPAAASDEPHSRSGRRAREAAPFGLYNVPPASSGEPLEYMTQGRDEPLSYQAPEPQLAPAPRQEAHTPAANPVTGPVAPVAEPASPVVAPASSADPVVPQFRVRDFSPEGRATGRRAAAPPLIEPGSAPVAPPSDLEYRTEAGPGSVDIPAAAATPTAEPISAPAVPVAREAFSPELFSATPFTPEPSTSTSLPKPDAEVAAPEPVDIEADAVPTLIDPPVLEPIVFESTHFEPTVFEPTVFDSPVSDSPVFGSPNFDSPAEQPAPLLETEFDEPADGESGADGESNSDFAPEPSPTLTRRELRQKLAEDSAATLSPGPGAATETNPALVTDSQPPLDSAVITGSQPPPPVASSLVTGPMSPRISTAPPLLSDAAPPTAPTSTRTAPPLLSDAAPPTAPTSTRTAPPSAAPPAASSAPDSANSPSSSDEKAGFESISEFQALTRSGQPAPPSASERVAEPATAPTFVDTVLDPVIDYDIEHTGGWVAPFGHWSRQADLDDETQPWENTVTREVGGGNVATTTSALVLPEMPRSNPFPPALNATGEILLTGSIELPRSLSNVGGDSRHFDNSDVDLMYDDNDREFSGTDSSPVSAIRAVSTHTSARGVISSANKPHGNRMLTVLLITAAAMAVVVVGLLIAGLSSQLF